jgi:hypothetical protein
MKSHINQLDTKRFGFNIARVDQAGDLLTTDLIPALKSQNVALIITRTDSEKLDEINALEDMGFRIKDIQSTWRHFNGQAIDDKYLNPDVRIRQASGEDILPFRRIAQNAFGNYGHYFADTRLDKDRCGEIYPDWAERTLTDKGAADKVLVAAHGNKIAGFLSIKIHEKEGTKYAAGIMGAVSEEFRGRNIFASLVINGLIWGQENNLSWQEHNALVVNYPVNRVFSKLGFQQVQSFITLHGWLDR